MPGGSTLVSYNNITRPFPDRQSLLASARQAAGKVIADPNQADAGVAQLSDALDDLQGAQGKHPLVMHAPGNAMAGQLQTHLAGRATAENKIESFLLKGVEFILEGFQVRFSSADWFEYMLSFFTWVGDIVPATCPPAPAEPSPVGNRFRIALMGDWGTGLYGAPVCAQSIAADPAGYDLLLHLGDVYYSGLDFEIQERFSKFWPQAAAPIGRSLNGNHEMFTGGHGYFGTLLPALGQTSSYFAFQNDFWTLAALDTAYHQPPGGRTGDLAKDQVDWLDKIIANAGNRKIVLFTHHQPFTLLDGNQSPNLMTWLQSYLAAGKIFAWYWGHEHRCVLYDPHPAFGFHGRCVGHGGFPGNRTDLSSAPFSPEHGSQWRKVTGPSDLPGALVLDSANLYIPTFETEFGPHGFMRLEFQDGHLTEFVRAPDGANIYLADLT
jgi:Calcineurin-like phosphoesterase